MMRVRALRAMRAAELSVEIEDFAECTCDAKLARRTEGNARRWLRNPIPFKR